uniref:Uncharacterized protein n=1 Tax=Strombidinopsis acuminata TaxID=141414 RepID=A0A7S3SSC6_9SPIT|mmetsp:Transcript_18031/g.54322  ORF Transcript_18031/g.54322 Transcript_18031/m.54322 type:complete len:188 (+) Transcript_18031:148-711(+)|eukprot:scaffold296293_cov30-Tisochrysis_lutea.AAC.1
MGFPHHELLLPSYLPERPRAKVASDWPPGMNKEPPRLGRRRLQRLHNEAFLDGPIEFDRSVDGSTIPFEELPFFQRGVAFTKLAAQLEALGLDLAAELADVRAPPLRREKYNTARITVKREASTASSSGDEAWVIVSRETSPKIVHTEGGDKERPKEVKCARCGSGELKDAKRDDSEEDAVDDAQAS